MTAGDEQLVGCFLAAFPSLSREEVPEASVETVAEWDSLGAITLVALVEEQFELDIPEAALDGLTSFSAIQGFLLSEHRLT